MKLRNIAGLVAGVILLLSSAAHGILGWQGLSKQLGDANTPADLYRGVKIGWLFGSAAILAFGIIATITFLRRLRGATSSTMPTLTIGLIYLAFGIWAIAISRDPFFMIFIVPGALLILASKGSGSLA